jgi:transcriptional regulator with XRE-family HTH domain
MLLWHLRYGWAGRRVGTPIGWEGSGRVSDYGSPTVRRRQLAAELRRLRDRANLTGEQVAERLGWSPSKISRYEHGRTGLKPADVRKLLDLFGLDGSRRDQLLALAEDARKKGWWEAYSDLPDELIYLIGLEDEARSSQQWQVEAVPGLLQTEAYARHLIMAYQGVMPIPPSQVERRVAARSLRQQVLTRNPPLSLSVVLDESALLRRLADEATMRAQLEKLIEVAQLPNVTLRVLPLDGRYPVITASFTLLQFGQDNETVLRDMVSLERLQSEIYFEGESETFQYRLAFASLTQEALSPADTLELIAERAQRVWAG